MAEPIAQSINQQIEADPDVHLLSLWLYMANGDMQLEEDSDSALGDDVYARS